MWREGEGSGATLDDGTCLCVVITSLLDGVRKEKETLEGFFMFFLPCSSSIADIIAVATLALLSGGFGSPVAAKQSVAEKKKSDFSLSLVLLAIVFFHLITKIKSAHMCFLKTLACSGFFSISRALPPIDSTS